MRKLSRMVRSFVFRKRMGASVEKIEDKIRSSLQNEGKDEIINGGFRVSLKEGSQLEVTRLPSSNIEQMELPLKQPQEFRKGEKHETTDFNRGVGNAKAP